MFYLGETEIHLINDDNKTKRLGTLIATRVVDPYHLNADPDPALYVNANPDPDFHFNADPDPENSSSLLFQD